MPSEPNNIIIQVLWRYIFLLCNEKTKKEWQCNGKKAAAKLLLSMMSVGVVVVNTLPWQNGRSIKFLVELLCELHYILVCRTLLEGNKNLTKSTSPFCRRYMRYMQHNYTTHHYCFFSLSCCCSWRRSDGWLNTDIPYTKTQLTAWIFIVKYKK